LHSESSLPSGESGSAADDRGSIATDTVIALVAVSVMALGVLTVAG
jgi:hypothetical protein